MEATALERVRVANGKLRDMLRKASEALAGRASFGVKEVRAIAEPVASMEPIVSQGPELRAAAPELQNELRAYAQNLGELNTALDRVRCVLLARCASVTAHRGHLQTLGLWTAAWQQTQPSDPL